MEPTREPTSRDRSITDQDIQTVWPSSGATLSFLEARDPDTSDVDGTDEKDGGDTDGTDEADGTDGTDATDGTDGTDGTDSSDRGGTSDGRGA